MRVKVGDTTGWCLVGVLDPQGAAGIRNRPSQGLLDFLVHLEFDNNPHPAD